nr:MAG TPA: zipper dimerization domain transcription factor-like protein [Caudoviricetes sp.]
MIYLECNESGAVVYQHFMPFDPIYGLGKTENELKQTGYLVNIVPEYTGEVPDGKRPELHYDGTDFSWTMVDAEPEPIDPGDKIAALETRIAELEAVNAAYLGLEGTV